MTVHQIQAVGPDDAARIEIADAIMRIDENVSMLPREIVDAILGALAKAGIGFCWLGEGDDDNKNESVARVE